MKTSDLSVKELAAIIGVSTDSIRRAVRKGEIPYTRVGTAYRLDLRQVLHQMQCRGPLAERIGQRTGRHRRPRAGRNAPVTRGLG
jgi:excisionase family DNA binding protein